MQGPNLLSLATPTVWRSLRQDLVLQQAGRTTTGMPSWTVYDPSAHRYFRLGPLEYEVLARWSLGDATRIAAAISNATSLAPASGDIEAIRDFFADNGLLAESGNERTARLIQAHTDGQQSILKKGLKGYLFFKIPLMRPQRFLEATWPIVRWMFSPVFRWLIIALSVAGILMSLQSWDVYLSSFSYLFEWQGMAAMAAAIIGVKVLHEFGHAYACRRFGIRVGAIGVAFLVFWPVLFTDTTEAWRLSSRRQRLVISSAGMIVELAIAGLSTFLWAILDEGPLRSTMFFLSSASWATTLVVNLNPFMRFDGYFLLSDLIDVPNLQERSFALGKWRLRRTLFGFPDPCPEVVQPRMQRGLIFYAYATWLHRVALFIGIATLLATFMAPAIGWPLAIIEIVVFIGQPIGREVAVWSSRRGEITRNWRGLLGLGALIGLCGLLFLPFGLPVSAPAMMNFAQATTVFAPVDAMVARVLVSDGEHVRAGQTLALLQAPELQFELTKVTRERVILARAIRSQTSALRSSKQLVVDLQALERAAVKQADLERQVRALTLTASADGIVSIKDRGLSEGVWVREAAALLTVRRITAGRVAAFAPFDQTRFERSAATAMFVPNAINAAPVALGGISIQPGAVAILSEPALASVYGGPIPVVKEGKHGWRPVNAIKKITYVVLPDAAHPLGAAPFAGAGAVILSETPRSAARRVWDVLVALGDTAG